MYLSQLNSPPAKPWLNNEKSSSQYVKRALNVVVIISVTLAASYFITDDNVKASLFSQGFFSQQQSQVQLADLTDAQVDMIIAVKNSMHEAKIQHD